MRSTELALVRFRLGDMAGFEDCAARIRAAVDRSDPAQRVRECFTTGVTSALAGDYPAARPMLMEVAELALSDALEDDPRSILLLALAAGFTGTASEALARGAVRVEGVRRRGAIGMLMPILAISASGRSMLGDHVGAYADAGEAAELAEHLGLRGGGRHRLRARWPGSRRLAGSTTRRDRPSRRARTLLDRAETTSAAAHHALTAAFCALCRGDMADVVDVLEARLEIDGGVGAMGEPLGVAPLLVEAYVEPRTSGAGRGPHATARGSDSGTRTCGARPRWSCAARASWPGTRRPRDARFEDALAGPRRVTGPLRARSHPPDARLTVEA